MVFICKEEYVISPAENYVAQLVFLCVQIWLVVKVKYLNTTWVFTKPWQVSSGHSVLLKWSYSQTLVAYLLAIFAKFKTNK